MTAKFSRFVPLLLASTAAAVLLGACDRSRQPSADASVPAAPASNGVAASDDVFSNSQAADQAALDAREQDIARREAALKEQQERVQADLAKSEAALAATRTQATPKSSKSLSTSSTDHPSVIAKQPSATLASNNSTSSASRTDSTVSSAGGPTSFTVPAGTPLQIELTQSVNTKKAKVGDTVTGRLHSPVMVADQNALETGTQVTGTVTQVVSGSSKIGGVPSLGLAFDSLVAENGTRVPISAKFLQQGTSDTAKDTAKIAGGAAAGAVIGHQVGDDNKGTIIGGILGGAAGAAAAQKTGGEVRLPSGTVIAVTADTSFTVER
jgi:hypothetical protein